VKSTEVPEVSPHRNAVENVVLRKHSAGALKKPPAGLEAKISPAFWPADVFVELQFTRRSPASFAASEGLKSSEEPAAKTKSV